MLAIFVLLKIVLAPRHNLLLHRMIYATKHVHTILNPSYIFGMYCEFQKKGAWLAINTVGHVRSHIGTSKW